MKQENPLDGKDKVSTALDVASAAASIAPWIGGPISNVLSGLSVGRKIERVKEVITKLAKDVARFETDVSGKYVKTEEFEELLEQTLNKVAQERHEEKRNIYGAFLADAIKSPGESYDEQIQFIRVIEELQPDHMKILKACMEQPEKVTGFRLAQNMNMFAPYEGCSYSQTLMRRIPDLAIERIEELVGHLNNRGITKIDMHPKMIQLPYNSIDMRGFITSLGQKLIKYLSD